MNRIRDIRKAKGLTLADLAAACRPATTAQTIGRLETGTRQLSLTWMNRIAAALEVEPASLMREAGPVPARIVAELGPSGPEALAAPREALLPTALAADTGPAPLVLAVTASIGEYRPGDLVWLRPLEPQSESSLSQTPREPRSGERPPAAFSPLALARAMNRDCLVPRPGGRFAFGRLIDVQGSRVGLLPPGAGHKQVVVDNPAWIALAFMLVRAL